MKYKESRTLQASDLRSLCIRKNWYTCGTNDEYYALLQRTHKPGYFTAAEMTTEKLAEIAADIHKHSDERYCNDGYLPDIPGIMFELAKICDTCFEEE